MQPYNHSFAKVFNLEFSGFSKRVTPYLIDFYEKNKKELESTNVLDLCCGTGYLANGFLRKGYNVLGVDASESMLKHFKANNSTFIKKGQASVVEADISEFHVNDKFGLVLSTYDSINHLENENLLISCFNTVYKILVNKGHFIFDMNTREALINWNTISVFENNHLMMVTKGIYDGIGDKAMIRFTGFSKTSKNHYSRFDQIIINTVFKFERVRALLMEIGWRDVYFAKVEDLSTPINEPENETKENQIFVVAQK